MNRYGLSRRTVLRGLLGGTAVTVGLPPLELFWNSNGTAFASGEGFPKRFGLFFWGNGMLPDRWVPPSDGADYTLSPQLAPLAGVKSDVSVVSGLAVKVPNVVPHGSGAAGILTGSPVLLEGGNETYAGPTLDQVIAEAIGGETRFRSIECGAACDVGLSHSGPNARNPAERDPYTLFQRIFGPDFRAPGETTEVDPRIGLRRSVLDAVTADITRLQARVGVNDRSRLEQHFDAVRDLERRLARLQEDPPSLAACSRPIEPALAFPDIDGRPQVSEKNRAICDILAMAMACDQTRVFSNFITQPVSNVLFSGALAGHHQLTHDEPGEQLGVHAIVLQIVAEYAYLVEALRNVTEGEGTLLDNSVIFGTSEISLGRTHSLEDIPMLIAGTGGGVLRKGIHYRSYTNGNASDAIISMMRAVGMRIGEFGTGEARATEGLGDIEA